MPSKDLKCEFCDKVFRKNELARHTKAKHVVELGQFLLQEYIENPNTNSLQRYAKGINPKNNPVYSKLYADASYYFGANPTFFEEDDSYSTYIKSDDNMKIHNDFLIEVIRSISMIDYINAEREIEIRSDKVRTIEREKKELEEKNKELEATLASYSKKIEQDKIIINEFKEAFESHYTIQNFKDEIKSLESALNSYKKEAEYNYKRYINIEEAQEKYKDSLMEEYNSKLKKINDQTDILFKENQEQKEKITNLTLKVETTVNTRLEKETKKLKEKLEKEHEKEIDEKDEEIDDLKKQLKKLKKASKKSSSDSE